MIFTVSELTQSTIIYILLWHGYKIRITQTDLHHFFLTALWIISQFATANHWSFQQRVFHFRLQSNQNFKKEVVHNNRIWVCIKGWVRGRGESWVLCSYHVPLGIENFFFSYKIVVKATMVYGSTCWAYKTLAQLIWQCQSGCAKLLFERE